jgi:hypothetical protein
MDISPIVVAVASSAGDLEAVSEQLISVVRFLNRNQISRGAASKLEINFGSVQAPLITRQDALPQRLQRLFPGAPSHQATLLYRRARHAEPRPPWDS